MALCGVKCMMVRCQKELTCSPHAVELLLHQMEEPDVMPSYLQGPRTCCQLGVGTSERTVASQRREERLRYEVLEKAKQPQKKRSFELICTCGCLPRFDIGTPHHGIKVILHRTPSSHPPLKSMKKLTTAQSDIALLHAREIVWGWCCVLERKMFVEMNIKKQRRPTRET
jgi:hypothetical protein